jgi:murein DD-endopeptidase MepM/ murein hydrolase activator NlpD
VRVIRLFFKLVLVGLVGVGLAYFLAGRADGPAIAVLQPALVGQTGTLEVTIDTPGGQLDDLSVVVRQGDHAWPLITLGSLGGAELAADGEDRLILTGALGKDTLPELEAGTASVQVTASRPVLWGLRYSSSETTHEFDIRLTPPRIAVASTHHYVNQGGAEVILYRVTPPDAESGVRVGDLEYPGFSVADAGLNAEPSLKIAIFALLHDQPVDVPFALYARDSVGNEGGAQFEHRVFPKTFRRSRISLDDSFLARVVPPILEQAPDLDLPTASSEELLAAYLKVNGDLRKINAATIATFANQTASVPFWNGAFRQLANSQVESGFADYRTYVYGGEEVDQQVHLGFDLATTANAPVEAAHRGNVLFADTLGIYGNSVILDHGMGLQSLYAHLSSFDVAVGDDVTQGQTLGLSGQTGLAGGDHLHFSVLVNGHFVNATEWWDPHWIEDRIVRKLAEAGVR